MVLHIVACLLITGVITELITKYFLAYSKSLIILNSQLFLVGMCLLIEIILFIKLSKRVFGEDFQEEQTYFRISLIYFLSTYSIRIVVVGLEIGYWNTYVKTFEKTPIWGATW